MTLTDEIKILDDKIKANQAQYDLGRDQASFRTQDQACVKKLNLSILHWVYHLVNYLH